MSTDTKPTPAWLLYGSQVLVQVFFGLNYLAAKVLLEEIPPRVWAPMRAGSAAVLLLLLARLLGRRFPTGWPTLGRLALFSVLGVVINQLCFAEGLFRTTPTHSSIIMTTIPVGTLLVAVLLRRERAGPWKLLSIAVGYAGVLLVIRPTGAALSQPMLVGDVLTLVNALSYSVFLVVSKRLMGRIDWLAGTAVLFVCGTLGLLVPGSTALVAFDPSVVSAQSWGLALFIVVFPTAGAYLLILWALAKVDSSIVAFFIYLQPLIATSLSVLLFGERLELPVVAGAALIFLAVFLALRPQR